MRIFEAAYGGVLYVKPASVFRIDPIYNLFFLSDYKFFLLIVVPIIFITLFVLEWKPRLTSAIVFIYSVIGGSLFHTIHGSLGQMQHKFHMIALLLLGFAIYYWLFHKNKSKKSNEWMIFPILLFFVATVYGTSFMSKMANLSEVPKWFTGEAMQSAIVKGHFQRVLAYSDDEIGALRTFSQMVAVNKPIAAFLGIGGLLIEFASFFLLIVSPKLRFVILVGLAVFHLIGGLLILPSFFGETFSAHAYIVIWAAYNAFPKKINVRV